VRDKKPFMITPKDIIHISFLKKNFDFKNKKILNFGSGKSGFSYLCKLLDAKVFEVDKKNKKETNFDKDISFTKDIEELKGSKFDLIYASHSLEHVPNIKEILISFEMLSKENTYFFFEVPDGEIDLSSRKKMGRIFPHIFFYRKEFFKKIFSENKNGNFLNMYDKSNINEFSNMSVTEVVKGVSKNKENIVIWTNQKLNLDEIGKITL